jgi:hypothetical protein
MVFEIRHEIVVIDQPVAQLFSGSSQQVRPKKRHVSVQGPLGPMSYFRGLLDTNFASGSFNRWREFVRHSALL